MNRPIIIVSKHIRISHDMQNNAALIIRVESGSDTFIVEKDTLLSSGVEYVSYQMESLDEYVSTWQNYLESCKAKDELQSLAICK